jgi:cytoskeletal protein CcmA (bactofilin family)
MLLRSTPVQPAGQKPRAVTEVQPTASTSRPVTSLLTPVAASDPSTKPSDGTVGHGGAERSQGADGAQVRSVIGKDLTIIGQGLRIVSAGALQIDGQIHGDVQGADVVVGESGQITGTVAGETVIVRGTVAGVIRGRQVSLEASSRVEGDIHHQALTISPGAEFDGRSRRSRSGESFDLGPMTHENDQPKPTALS